MVYRVEHWKDGSRLSDAAWTGSFAELKGEAIRSVDAAECDRVEVFDEDGQIRFQYPRVMSKAR